MIIGVVLQTAAQNVGMFIGCRFLIGVGLSWATMAAPVLITELAFPTHRAPMTGLYNSSWYLGSIVAAWVTYGTFRIDSTWSWRIPSVLQGIPSALQLVLVFLVVPESPRWLIANGREEEALRVITEYHCAGDASDPLAQFEYQEIKEALRIEREINRTSSYRDLFATPGNRRRMVCIISLSGRTSRSRTTSSRSSPTRSFRSGPETASSRTTSTSRSPALGLPRPGRRTSSTVSCSSGTSSRLTAARSSLIAPVAARSGLRPPPACVSRTRPSPPRLPCTPSRRRTTRTRRPATLLSPFSSSITRSVSTALLQACLLALIARSDNIAMSPLLSAYTIEILPFNLRTKGLFVSSECVNASLVFNQYGA
jgi:hypothetical protein